MHQTPKTNKTHRYQNHVAAHGRVARSNIVARHTHIHTHASQKNQTMRDTCLLGNQGSVGNVEVGRHVVRDLAAKSRIDNRHTRDVAGSSGQ
jgi:hypothetical protein